MGSDALRACLEFLFRILTRVEVVGVSNIPERGGCLLALNHLSRLDAPLVFAFLTRRDSTGLVANKYKQNFFFRWVVEKADGIWLDRDNPDYGALRAAVKVLREGRALGIAPEGTRSTTGSLMEPKPGVAFLAVKANVPIVPIAITGTENTMRDLLRFHRSPVRIEFGPPFTLKNGSSETDQEKGQLSSERRSSERDASLQKAADEIMCQIAHLLPEKYWGVYADHPRLFELLHSSN